MSQKAFTLLEVLVVVSIVGMLATMAIPQYAEYKGSALEARAKSDLRAVATAEEAYFTDHETYKSCIGYKCADILPGIESLSTGITLQITATASGFTGTSSHPLLGGIYCNWVTGKGGFKGCS